MSIQASITTTGEVSISKEVFVALIQSMGGCVVLDGADLVAALDRKCSIMFKRCDDPFKLSITLEDHPSPL